MYDEYMQKVGKNLGTTMNAYNSAYKEFAKIDKDVLKISGEAIGIDPQLVNSERSESVESDPRRLL